MQVGRGTQGWACLAATAGIAAVAVGLGGCSGPRWRFDLDRALRDATEQNRLVLVEFWSLFSRPCAQMDSEVFSDPAVQEVMKDMICVRLDRVLHGKLAKQRQVTTTPTFLILRPDGSEIGSAVGPMTARQFRRFLLRAKVYR